MPLCLQIISECKERVKKAPACVSRHGIRDFSFTNDECFSKIKIISKYSRFWLIGPSVNWGSRLYGTNVKEQNLIEKIARDFIVYLGQHAI
jgi:hypothetical protein